MVPYRFDLLGPLSVSGDGRVIPLGPVKQRLFLASLLLRPNEVVITDELVATLWLDEPPPSAAANLRTYAHGLRRALGAEAVHRMPATTGGYLLRLRPEERDLDRFDAAVARGRQALAKGDPARAEAELAAAVGLWRGAPLADLPLPASLARQVAQLEERRSLAEEDYAEAQLATGASAEVVHRLRTLLDRYPLRQRAWGQLMVALYRIGDVAGALATFRQARQALAEETGLDPGPELTQLHDDILHHRPEALRHRPVQPASGTPRPDVPGGLPAQLPLAGPYFVGRDAELARLDAALGSGLDGPADGPRTVIISAVSGMAGIGKTALALHWAHRVSERFPDGQLYANLRGYDDADAMTPADALLGFLEALDVPIAQMPTSTEARIGLYRSLLAARQMLIVLDNARDSDQVRPLLPGAGRSMVVTTSRSQLSELVAREGARPFVLNVLTDEEARSLLGRRFGAERLAAEPAAVASIIEATGRLPLALSIVAARVATRPTFPLDAFATQLRLPEARLDALADGDVRRVFSWSHRALSDEAARLFRLLGLHPGPELTREAAAALVGASPATVTPLLDELTRLHLLTEHLPGRYSLHDLLRTYAAELAQSSEATDTRRAARHRLYDHYLHSAHPAATLLQPQWPAVTPVPALSGNARVPIADHDAASAWFAVERPTLLRVVRQAAETGFEPYACQLAWALTAFLAPRGLWQDQLTAQQIAAAAAERTGDLAGLAEASRLLARAASRLGDHETAEARLQQAVHLYERLDDQVGLAQTLHNYTEQCFLRGRLEEALAHGRAALRLHRLTGNRSGEGRALNAVGYLYAVQGDYAQAIADCTEALSQQQRIDDRNGQAATLDSLGFAYDRLGDHDRAATCYERSIRLFRQSSDQYHEAETLTRLGDTRQAMGDPAAAADAWRLATRIYDRLGDRAAEEARQRLARLGQL